MKTSQFLYRISEEFSNILNEWLSEAEMEIVIERNKTPDYKGMCATHDFCDPNEAMIQAFEKVMGVVPEPTNEAHSEIINEAWDIAKEQEFKTPQNA